MERTWQNIAISLAGAAQAVSLVEQLAKTGYLTSDEFVTAVDSLFQQNPHSVESVFGSHAKLYRGFDALDQLLNHHRDTKNSDLLRYMLGIIHIQARLAKKQVLLNTIGERLQKAASQAQHFGPSHDNVVANIADIYTDTISTFQYRIQVTGEYNYLQQPRLASQIRVLLLSAVRAITLWRQVGGSRWQLLLYRSKISAANRALLEQAKTEQI